MADRFSWKFAIEFESQDPQAKTAFITTVTGLFDEMKSVKAFKSENAQPIEYQGVRPREFQKTDTTPAPRAVNWRAFKTGTPGGWCYTNENEPLRDTLLAAQGKPLVLEGYTYRLSGDEDQFIQRFPAGHRK